VSNVRSWKSIEDSFTPGKNNLLNVKIGENKKREYDYERTMIVFDTWFTVLFLVYRKVAVILSRIFF
jgi:hypothetical protein